MINLLEHVNGPRFENVYIYSKSLYQPKYVYLEELLRPVKGVKYFPFNASENIMHPAEARPNSIFIFDDVACDNQDVIREHLSMGRHNRIDSFYLCQTYAKIPKHLDLNLKHIFNDHVGTDVKSFEDFKRMCALCWTRPYDFLTIFKDCDIDKGRYRKTFVKSPV
nr:unnamed protein product [Callosobruchus chinensis]